MQSRRSALLLFAIFALALNTLPLLAQSTNGPSIVPPDDGFDPGLLIGALLFITIFITACALLLGFGLAGGLVFCALAGILTALGILSSSVAIGFIRQSPTSGLRALFLQIGAVAGIFCGIVAAWAVAWLTHYHWSTLTRLVAGGTCGLLGGILIAWLFNFAWGKIAGWILARFDRKKQKIELVDV